MYDQSRREEVLLMQNLIREISTINKGSNFLDKMNSCIEMAQKLQKDNMVVPRASFVDFIHNEATKN